nr:reverse transcriptase domain-containing protein [Tanacetum cinerariifolium]GEY51895.1 reverse transcriptase domain-containing protein [Tanacetum cinerariifolium]
MEQVPNEVERDPKTIMKQPLIPYLSRLNKEKLQDKSDIQVHKFFQMFKNLHFNISLVEALALMPKYHKMLKDFIFDKEKLLGLENTSLTKNCSAVLLKKLPKKLKDPGRFLIPCDFHRLESCMALADLASIAEDVFVTSKHPHKHGNELINMINFIDIACEDHFLEVLKFKKLNHPLSGSTTSLSDSLYSLTPFETSDFLLEEFADELALLDPFSTRNKDDNFDLEVDLRKIEYLLNQDPSTESDIEINDPILERLTYEPALVYSPLLGDDDDDLFDRKSNNDEWKKLLYGDFYKEIDSEKD